MRTRPEIRPITIFFSRSDRSWPRTAGRRNGFFHGRIGNALSNQDRHSREGDPRFAMPIMGDFRLLEGSPALGAGRACREVKTDFFAQRGRKNEVSLGAAEKSADDYPQPAFCW